MFSVYHLGTPIYCTVDRNRCKIARRVYFACISLLCASGRRFRSEAIRFPTTHRKQNVKTGEKVYRTRLRYRQFCTQVYTVYVYDASSVQVCALGGSKYRYYNIAIYSVTRRTPKIHTFRQAEICRHRHHTAQAEKKKQFTSRCTRILAMHHILYT